MVFDVRKERYVLFGVNYISSFFFKYFDDVILIFRSMLHQVLLEAFIYISVFFD